MLETLYHNFRMCFPVWSFVSSYKVSMHRPSFITNIGMPAVRVNEIQVSVKYEAFIVFFLCVFVFIFHHITRLRLNPKQRGVLAVSDS